MIPAGVIGMTFKTASSIARLLAFPVPNRSTYSDVGCAIANGKRDLHHAFAREPGRHNVLRDVARNVSSGPVNFGRILSRKRPAAMRATSAIRIDDDLAPRQAGVGRRASFREASGWIHQVFDIWMT